MARDLPLILITGKTGQVGFELQRSLAVLGRVVALDRSECDLSQPEALRALVQRLQPDVIVNPAAYTAVDKAETDQAAAQAINGAAPGVLAEEAARLNALLVHYSTDYVFAGDDQTEPYTENAATAPRSVYGQTKLAGEDAIRAAHARHLILRTSWVYGAHGANFLKTALRLVQERDALKIVADQIGAPTAASLIADVTAQLVAQYLHTDEPAAYPYGTYHLAAEGETSWHGYARYVAAAAQQAGVALKATPERIEAIPTSAYPLPAPRPANSRLDTQKLRATFGLTLPQWQAGVDQVLTLLLHR
ncbi:dTDP-4-dehydrorhamnose reductase [Amantichitinum ursilacus]|uniref:dTDP-4-dehydrorhamnose reductase n=1 Tax=Amantichitinum ursilacus TaxID=857265 RepID=A0A0N0XGH6_9NEIS|nr:dTDP-4-dehydrorhamnose reductase [Amantichitinum ursilacus]KPC50106.1 dTDP-4-dehydrorhamnose reductase [Amantichitinum ursilacus]